MQLTCRQTDRQTNRCRVMELPVVYAVDLQTDRHTDIRVWS